MTYDKYLLTYLIIYLLAEKLTGSQPVKKFPIFYGTRKFITSFTSARHLSLSWASSIQSILPHPNSWRSILILSSHLRLGLTSGLFLSGFARNKYSQSITDSNMILNNARQHNFFITRGNYIGYMFRLLFSHLQAYFVNWVTRRSAHIGITECLHSWKCIKIIKIK